MTGFGRILIMSMLIVAIASIAAEAAVFETITVSTSSQSLSTTILAGNRAGQQITHCLCSLEGGTIRIRLDGTAPTSSVGHLISTSNSPFTLDNRAEIDGFRAIRYGDTDGTLSVTCW